MEMLILMDFNVVVSRLNPGNVNGLYNCYSAARFDREPVQSLCRRGCIGQSGRWARKLARLSSPLDLIERTAQSGFKAFAIERLQEIIQRVYFECAQSELIMRGNKDDHGHRLQIQSIQHGEPIQ